MNRVTKLGKLGFGDLVTARKSLRAIAIVSCAQKRVVGNCDERPLFSRKEWIPKPLQVFGKFLGTGLGVGAAAIEPTGDDNRAQSQAQNAQNKDKRQIPARDRRLQSFRQVRSRIHLLRSGAAEDGDVVARRKIDTNRTVFALPFIVLLKQPTNFVRLHAHDRVPLWVEVAPTLVHLEPDELFVKLLAVALKGLFRDEFQEPGLLG